MPLLLPCAELTCVRDMCVGLMHSPLPGATLGAASRGAPGVDERACAKRIGRSASRNNGSFMRNTWTAFALQLVPRL
eukprot:2796373-Pleurochrysis_carterae.AAC.4